MADGGGAPRCTLAKVCFIIERPQGWWENEQGHVTPPQETNQISWLSLRSYPVSDSQDGELFLNYLS